ncbi:MAG: hypothetical protein AAF363_22150 [Bacteroidota bacterium]
MKNFTKIIASLFFIGIISSCSLNDDSDIAPSDNFISINQVDSEDNVNDGGKSGENPPPSVGGGKSGENPPPSVGGGKSGENPPPSVDGGKSGENPPPSVDGGKSGENPPPGND